MSWWECALPEACWAVAIAACRVPVLTPLSIAFCVCALMPHGPSPTPHEGRVPLLLADGGSRGFLNAPHLLYNRLTDRHVPFSKARCS